MDPPDRLVPIPPSHEPLVQIVEASPQILPVLLLGHPVHADRRVLALSRVGAAKRVDVDQMGEREDPRVRISSRSFRYLPKFR
jgi:hypothetical protein